MSHWRRVMAFILTVLLAVHGLPVVSDARVETASSDGSVFLAANSAVPFATTAEDWKANYPKTAMRFVQTGFRKDSVVDKETGKTTQVGILTMSLQVKPEPGVNNEALREGVFVFQTDAYRIIPVTRPRNDASEDDSIVNITPEERRAIRASNGKIAVVSNTSGMPADFQNFLNDTTKSERISDRTDFGQIMSTNCFNGKYTGYLVSSTRADKEGTGLLDCYFQFYFDGSNDPEPDEDGYVNVIDLDFECYAGDTGEVTAENVLFGGSIRVPETAVEAQEIVDQFKYGNIPLAMGGAGFIQKYEDQETWSSVEGSAYYYYDEPVLSTWRKGTLQRSQWSTTGAQAIVGESGSGNVPGIWYQNIDSTCRVEQFSMFLENTVDTKKNNPDADFFIPSADGETADEAGPYPRYRIPTYEKSQKNDDEQSWIPQVYLNEVKNSPLKYYISTGVSSTSQTSPQHEDLVGFVEGLKWEFVLQVPTAMDSLESYHIIEEEGEGRLVPTTDGYTVSYYRIKEATLTEEYQDPNDLGEDGKPKTKKDPRLAKTDLDGTKLWVVYEAPDPDDPSADTYLMRTPVGVTLDMIESDVSYDDQFADPDEIQYDEEDNVIPFTGRARVPQFHVSYEAADPENYIWNTEIAGGVTGGEKARVAFHAIYDPDGRNMTSGYVEVALYIDNRVPTDADLDTSVAYVENEIVYSIESSIKSSAGEDEVGFCVGNTQVDGSGTEIINDAVDEDKANLRSTLYDQYRMPYQNKWSTLELVPTAETQSLYAALGKVCPFEVVRKSGNSYTIIYRNGRSVNDVVEGEHILRATYTEPGWKESEKVIEERTLYVSKPKDRLTYIRTQLNNSNMSVVSTRSETRGNMSGTVIEMMYDVPVRGVDYSVTTNSEQVTIAELANQWRNPEWSLEDLSEFDLVSGIRNESGSYIDVNKATDKGFHITYEVSYPTGSVPGGIDFSNIGNGAFTYDSNTLEGSKFNLTLIVTYDGVTRFLEYQFTFTRQPRTLQEIAIFAPSQQTSYTITVPVPAVGSVEQILDVVPFDQYGSQWDWGAVEEAYGPGGRLNSGTDFDPWTVYTDDELPVGVSLTGHNNMYVTVTSAAKDSSFTIKAKYAGCTSNEMVINIVREPSKPSVLRNIYYNGNNQITPPDKNSPNAVYQPTLQVFDQYETLMEHYTIRWRYSVSPESADQYVSVNASTGELTVQSCAPDCTIEITAVVAPPPIVIGSSKSETIKVAIKRDLAYPDSVQVVEDSVDLPSSADTDMVLRYLTATGTTQYGEAQKFQQDALTWRLESVKFADGTVLTRTDGEDTGIDYDSSTLTYSARNIVFFTARGGLRFARTTQAGSIPRELSVTVTCSNGVKTTKTITVNAQTSVADQLYFPQDRTDYTEGVQVPASGSTVTIPLYVYVRDQYGVVISDQYGQPLPTSGAAWDLTWSYELPRGVTLGADGHSIVADHTVQPGSIEFDVTCKYQDASGVLRTLEETLYISFWQNEPLVPSRIDITGYKKGSAATKFGAEAESFTLSLPVKPSGTGTSYEAYTMTWTVRDQFTNAISRAVEWSVPESDNGVRAEITDASAGILRLFYTDDVVQAVKQGEDIGFTLRVEAEENSDVFKTIRVKLNLAASVSTYATPVMIVSGEEGVDYVTENNVVKPIIPIKGDPAREVKIGFTVYDQYGEEMPDELATIGLKTASAGLNFVQSDNARQGTLKVGSTVTGLLVTVEAYPKGKPQNVRTESSLLITLSKGTAYAFELTLADGNPDTYEIPTWTWGTGETANVPVDVTDQVLVRAEVVDQYNAWMPTVSNLYHPVWEFAGDHPGVEFGTGDEDGDGIAEGEDIFLNISNRAFAVPDGKLVLRLHTSNQPEDEYFTKTYTLQLTREPAEAFYMDIMVTDNDGNPVETLGRPYAQEKQRVYWFKPVVYDQYGAVIEEIEVDKDMITTSLEEQEGILIEKTYQKGQSEKKGDPPSGYKIYSVVYKNEKDTKGTRTLLAEFDRLTGKLIIYTECNCIDKLVFAANCSQLTPEQGGEKEMEILYLEEELRPEIVKINGVPKDYVISGAKTPIESYAYPSVYDQYGATYAGSVSVVWDLVLPQKDANGEYLPYDTELDKEGNERPPSQFLVTKADGDDHGTTVTVQPESFYTNKIVLLECIVIDSRYLMDQSRWKSGYAQINVHRPTGGSGVNVYFDAGEYGKLVGESVIPVAPGSAPENPPGVKTEEGYGFMGWTSDGVLVVDASKIAVFGDITYTAVYKDITDTIFVEGYRDNTFRPEQHITRAEFVSMVVRPLGGYSARASYGSYFKDVPNNQWYTSAVNYAKAMGIIDGYGDGTFRPNNPITRAEAARILADAAQLTSTNYGTFSDVDPDTWYAEYIEALAEAGVANGYTDGTFRPHSYITRAESTKLIVQITVNALNELERDNIQKYAYCPFTDIRRGHWAYAYILRAAGVA